MSLKGLMSILLQAQNDVSIVFLFGAWDSWWGGSMRWLLGAPRSWQEREKDERLVVVVVKQCPSSKNSGSLSFVAV